MNTIEVHEIGAKTLVVLNIRQGNMPRHRMMKQAELAMKALKRQLKSHFIDKNAYTVFAVIVP